MGEIDKRNKLDEEPFSYKVSKDNKVLIYWNGKQISILKGSESSRFLSRMESAENTKSQQLIMAKVTGNFKHGNEKNFKR